MPLKQGITSKKRSINDCFVENEIKGVQREVQKTLKLFETKISVGLEARGGCSCLFLLQHFVTLFLRPTFVTFVTFVSGSHVLSFLWNETRCEPSRRYCLLSHNWISKYRVSNKLETVKLGKCKIRNRISFVFFSKKSIGWEIELQLNFPRIDKTRSLKESRLP